MNVAHFQIHIFFNPLTSAIDFAYSKLTTPIQIKQNKCSQFDRICCGIIIIERCLTPWRIMCVCVCVCVLCLSFSVDLCARQSAKSSTNDNNANNVISNTISFHLKLISLLRDTTNDVTNNNRNDDWQFHYSHIALPKCDYPNKMGPRIYETTVLITVNPIRFLESVYTEFMVCWKRPQPTLNGFLFEILTNANFMRKHIKHLMFN